MIDTLPPSETTAQRHQRMLQELAEIGMELAREVRRQAMEASDKIPATADLGLVFTRIARAVRQTIALEARLEQACEAPRPARPDTETRWRVRRRKEEVGYIVGEAIRTLVEANPQRHELGESLDWLHERLEDDEDEAADFADRPMAELVARICRDLGVPFDLCRFEDVDGALEAAPSAEPDPPYPDPPPLPHRGMDWPPPLTHPPP